MDENMAQARAHINATIIQLLYTSNMVHDLWYRWAGFLSIRLRSSRHVGIVVDMALTRLPVISSSITSVAEAKRGTRWL